MQPSRSRACPTQRPAPSGSQAQTNRMPLIGDTITWREDLKLDVLDNSNELRILLCRDKNTGTKKGTSVIAACGIFVNEIIEAVPIDKYFEMFKPNQGGEGGFIRIGLDFSPVGSQPAAMRSIFEESGSGAKAAPNLVSRQPAKKKRVLLPVLLSVGLSVAAAGTAVVVRALKKR